LPPRKFPGLENTPKGLRFLNNLEKKMLIILEEYAKIVARREAELLL